MEQAAFYQADAVIMFGGVEACESLRKKIPRGVKALLHGHKLGFGIIGRKRLGRQGLEEPGGAVAYDCSMFDQQACLAPHIYYVEAGGEVSPQVFCRTLAEAMERLNLKMPRGKISPGEASAIHQLRAKYEFRELNGEEVLLLASPP